MLDCPSSRIFVRRRRLGGEATRAFESTGAGKPSGLSGDSERGRRLPITGETIVRVERGGTSDESSSPEVSGEVSAEEAAESKGLGSVGRSGAMGEGE